MADETTDTKPQHTPRLGLALGGGVGRGWTHIGVIRALIEAGLKPDVIAGTSIGAVVGGCYAAGKLDALEAWARSLTAIGVMRMMDFRMRQPSMIGGRRLERRLRENLGDARVEALPMPFAAITTDLLTGHEVWRNRGDLVDAIRASYALPGVFPPIPYRHRLLIDGGIVNPVPVSACRALGADVVIAVSLHTDLAGQARRRSQGGKAIPGYEMLDSVGALEKTAPMGAISGIVNRVFRRDPSSPSLFGVMFSTLQIVTERMSRARLAADPPDVLLMPPLGHISMVEFHRAEEMIAIGRHVMRDALDDVHLALEQAGESNDNFA